ncbi:YhgE/Pip domain-containing protein [Paenibacillus tianjinensis]|uniref:YhgE/Pip domain-containing protein n=2 Tax=Paenibacillus tianjinensis TaxID=2810347 RepID=A0ABX7LPB1_9BACL|nr:YhgE/Pip domain-containing protein [Paenibacillus tianjinensis]
MNDWRNLFKVPVAVLLIIALILLPSVYDWVNVAAVWNPYSNTSGIRIAVSSLDEGAKVQGKSLNIGQEVLASLRNNHSLGWTFTDSAAAVAGVQRGDYYASIVIPANFSRRMAGILEGKLVKPEVEYTVNEKINAIAPKITDKGASAVTSQISEKFTETISSTVLTALSAIDQEFQSELPVIRRVEQGLFKLEASLSEIDQAGKLVLKLEQRWPEITSSAERIASLQDKLPAVEEAGAAAEMLDAHWGQISEAATRLQNLESKLPELERAAQLVTELDSHFGQVEDVLDRASARLAEAGSVVKTAAEALPQVDRLAAATSNFGQELEQFLERSSTAFAAIPEAVQQNLYLLQQTGDAAAQLAAQLQAGAGQQRASQLELASARLAAGSDALAHTAALLGAVNTLAPGTVGAGELRALSEARAQYAAAASQAGGLAVALQGGARPDSAGLSQFSFAAGQGMSMVGGLITRFSAETLPAVTDKLQRLTTAASTAATALQQAPQRLAALDTMLAEAGNVIQSGQNGLAGLQQNLPAIRQEVHAAATGITDNMGTFDTFVTEVLPRIQSGLPAAGTAVHEAAEFARKDLPAAEEKFRTAADLISTGLPRAGKGVEHAATLVREDLPTLETAVRKAADTLRQIKEEVNLEEIGQLLGGDIKSKSDFLANPVVLTENKLYPIPNYGSAMTPFYVVLSLWVGGTLLISLLRTGVDTGGKKYLGYELYFGRLLTFLTVGILQALVAVLGNIFILKCYVADKVGFVLFAVLISIVFVTIVFTLVSVFGNIGKGIAIVFMVLQFSSSGGTFPVSTTGHFFQALNPFMPFTYAISLLREAVGGIVPEVAIRDALLLLLFGLLALLLALTLQKPLAPFIRKSAEQAEKSKLIS